MKLTDLPKDAIVAWRWNKEYAYETASNAIHWILKYSDQYRSIPPLHRTRLATEEEIHKSVTRRVSVYKLLCNVSYGRGIYISKKDPANYPEDTEKIQQLLETRIAQEQIAHIATGEVLDISDLIEQTEKEAEEHETN